MLPKLKTPTLPQKIAHWAMIALCVLLGLGVISAAALPPQSDKPATTPLNDGSDIVLLNQLATTHVKLESPVNGEQSRAEMTTLPASSADNSSSIQKPGVIQMEVTAYCACTKCCGKKAKGITASGKLVSYNQGKFVAADTDLLPFGTKIVIPGYHAQAVEVIDRGSAIKGNRLDVYFPTHQQAANWGRKTVTVTVLD